MLEFWKDGKRIVCRAIFDQGQPGQVVILDNVSFGENPDSEDKPLASYPQPSWFTIVTITQGHSGKYVLADADGHEINVNKDNGWYLYEIGEWLSFTKMFWQDKLARKNQKIERLEGQVDLLKDILVRQGVRVLTQAEAESLGLQSSTN